MKVNFMILGAQKTATTSLFAVLNAHPNLEGCRNKEPDFFSFTKDWKKDLPNYEKLYTQKDHVLYFEASPSYTFYPLRNLTIWDDIFEYNPEMKFIYIVRNPIQRIVSSYMHSYERGYTDYTLHDAILKNPFFIDVSRYATQIIPYIKKFGQEKVLIIDFDDLKSKNDMVMTLLADFLNIDKKGFGDFNNVKMNRSVGGGKRHRKWDNPPFYLKIIKNRFPRVWKIITNNSSRSFKEKPTLGPDYEEMIVNFLSIEIDTLETIMGKNLQHWKKIEPTEKVLSTM